MSALMELAQRIEDTPIGTALAESRYAFPIIEGVHLIVLSISVGLIFLTDLRLLGLVMRRVPVTDVLHHLRPYVLGGFAIVFVTGGLLFWAEAVAVVESPATPFKFAFMALAGLNAAYFEFVTARQSSLTENLAVLPRAARVAGLTSIALWILVIVFGRLIAYIPHWS
jgi:hypothetical protein